VINTILYSRKRRSFIFLKPPQRYIPPEEPFRLTLIDWGTPRGEGCSARFDFNTGQDMTNWEGNSYVICTADGESTDALMWWEMEHSWGSEPFYIRIWCGAYIEECQDIAQVLVGYRRGDALRLEPVADIPYSFENPGEITLYGVFPYPSFVVALYHRCSTQFHAVAGVWLIRHRAWVEQ